jgi:hypothetical protein
VRNQIFFGRILAGFEEMFGSSAAGKIGHGSSLQRTQ